MGVCFDVIRWRFSIGEKFFCCFYSMPSDGMTKKAGSVAGVALGYGRLSKEIRPAIAG
jgi:hypothetical protein